MNSLTRIIVAVLTVSISLFFGCDELDTTQSKRPKVIFENNLDSLPADGISWVIVTVQFHRLLTDNQSVKISTTSGTLIEFPATSLNGGSQTLEASPNSDEFKFILVASTTPDENVLLSVVLNNIVAYTKFEFTEP
jgi:hypothetical protein